MHSGNSGTSIHSSSYGDDNDDYDDPQVDSSSVSSFLNLPTPHSHFPPPPPPPFDPLSPYFAFSPFDQSNCTTTSTITPPTHTSTTTTKPTTTIPTPTIISQNPNPNLPIPGADPTAAPRGSKKRSRASRRAPTTVLTTDTSNFRAMVQEFTGFPAPPFAPSLFTRPRLDLFAPPPFARKAHFMSSLSSSSSSLVDVIASIARSNPRSSAVENYGNYASLIGASSANAENSTSFDIRSILRSGTSKVMENFSIQNSGSLIDRASTSSLYGWNVDRNNDHQDKQNEEYGNQQQQ